MTKASSKPERIMRLLDKYRSLVIVMAFLLIGLFADSQVLVGFRQKNNAKGFEFKELSADSLLRLPQDTLHLLVRDSGSMAYRGGMLWLWTGYLWQPNYNTGGGGTGGGGSSTQVFAPELYFTNSGSNPTLPNVAETNLIMQSNNVTADMWYRGLTGSFNADTINYYATANNALLNNWTGGTAINIHGFFPTVFKVGSTYYMFLKNRGGTLPADFNAGDIYLYSSTNKTTWTVLNGGAPAITHSATTTDWRNKIYNVGVAVVGTTLHILVEGMAASGSYSTNAQLGYASASLSSPVFTLPSTPQFANGYNPDIIYVPEKNALLVTYNDLFYFTSSYKSYQRFAKASLSSTLTDPKAWAISPYYGTSLADTSLEGPHYPSDFAIAFTPGKTYPAMMTYCYDQAQGYQAYLPLIHTPLELFESIPDYSSSAGSSQWANVTGGIRYSGTQATVKTPSTTGTANMAVQNSDGFGGGLSVKSVSAAAYGAFTAGTFGLYTNLDQVIMADLPSGKIKFATGGNTERMRLDSAGNVLIGKTSPAIAHLDIQGGGTDQYVNIKNVDSSTSGSAGYRAYNNRGLGGGLAVTSSLYTTYGALAANNLYLYSSLPHVYLSDNPTGYISWATGGNTETMRLLASGSLQIANLSGTGTRMVVASSTGVLSTQAIPGGGSGGDVYLANANPFTNANTFTHTSTTPLTVVSTHVGAARIGINHIPSSGTNYNAGFDLFENSVAKWSVASHNGTYEMYNQAAAANGLTISPTNAITLWGLAGYNKNENGSMTNFSIPNKKYVDSLYALALTAIGSGGGSDTLPIPLGPGLKPLGTTGIQVSDTIPTKELTVDHIKVTGTTPTATVGAAAGTGASAVVSWGKDHAFVLTVTTGTSPGTGTVATITPGTAFHGSNPIVQCRMPLVYTNALPSYRLYFGAGAWRLEVNSALTASTSYQWEITTTDY